MVDGSGTEVVKNEGEPIKEEVKKSINLVGYEAIRVSSKGWYGSIYEVRREGDEQTFAMKIIDCKKYQNQFIKWKFNEKELLSIARSDYIYTLVDSYSIHAEMLEILVFEKLEVDLSDTTNGVDSEMASNVLHDICQGLDYLHNLKWLHLDVSPSNIMRGKSNWKLIDLGCAFNLQKDLFPGFLIGCPIYAAPEIHRGSKLSPLADIFSLGASISSSILKLSSNQFHCYSSHCLKPDMLEVELKPKKLLDIIMSMVDEDYNLRPTAKEVLDLLKDLAPEEHVE